MTETAKHSLDSASAESPTRPSKISKTQDFRDHDDDDELLESGVVTKPMSPNPRLQRYLVAIEYIGTRFSGSQKQLNCRTVVGVLEEAFHKFIGQPVSVSLSSRTDAGVHALSNVCHVDVERISKRKPDEVLPPHEPVVVRRAVNHFLQKNEGDIMVIDVQCVPADFHARFKAQERTKHAKFLLDIMISVPSGRLVVSEDLGFGIRRRHRCFVVTARARSFLYHQVRLLVGVLKSVGTGDLTISDVERVLNAKSVMAASPMAPACGLYLGHVNYDLP
ncbi:hypothetical protein GH714_005574 [Hevea brasiliensis]|uniref:tRNA pseudouridine synthase n=1 Tax=Hevea brasiliensis TaxID=3981 RepID=A0A6A6L0R8_HEVBR|nr:hypothetical protein GH714_005574 [Hevea brasiliensis]